MSKRPMPLKEDVKRGYFVFGAIRTVHHAGAECGSKSRVLVSRDWNKVTCRRCLARWSGKQRRGRVDDRLPVGVYVARVYR